MNVVDLQQARHQRAELSRDLADLVGLIDDMADAAAQHALRLSGPVADRDPDLARAMNRHCRRRFKGAVRRQVKPLGKAATDLTIYASDAFNVRLNSHHLADRRSA